MEIIASRCTGCGACTAYCPVRAIAVVRGTARVDQSRCVECDTCRRVSVCPANALVQPELEWPRLLRARFSNPLLVHPSTGVWGRGTTEVKTADVNDRFPLGRVGIAAEVGRPGVSAGFDDVEEITSELAGMVEFVRRNPVTELIDPDTGLLRDDAVRGERVLSAIVEFTVPQRQAVEALDRVRRLAESIQTVVTVGLIAVGRDGIASLREQLKASGFAPRPNGKVNVGLGRPSR